MNEVEYHVASYIVRTTEENAAAVAKKINALPRLEVHVCEQGKLIVTAEADNVRVLAECLQTLEQLDDVLAVSPVYHEYDGEANATA